MCLRFIRYFISVMVNQTFTDMQTELCFFLLKCGHIVVIIYCSPTVSNTPTLDLRYLITSIKATVTVTRTTYKELFLNYTHVSPSEPIFFQFQMKTGNFWQYYTPIRSSFHFDWRPL